VSACPSLDSDLAVALDQALTRAQVAELDVAELLERIALVTGVDLSTAPTAEAVAAGLAVLDSLSRPTTVQQGWRWLSVDSHIGCNGFEQRDGAERHAAEHQLRNGYFVQLVRDGRALAPMYCPPTRGSN
jgi:hypothetical protein